MGFYEIYQGQLHDLLNERKKLHAREDGKNGVVVAGLKEFEIVNVEGLMQVFAYGNNARSTGTKLFFLLSSDGILMLQGLSECSSSDICYFYFFEPL